MIFIIKGFRTCVFIFIVISPTLWQTESEQKNPMDSIKDIVRSFVKVPEFDKHLKKAEGHIGRNIVEITIKMKTIVRKPLMIKTHWGVLPFFAKIQSVYYSTAPVD